MNSGNVKFGNGLRYFGWFVVIYNLVKYGYGLYEILSDASVQVYALLVVMEGLMMVSGGLFIVWLGGRIRKNAAQDPPSETPQ